MGVHRQAHPRAWLWKLRHLRGDSLWLLTHSGYTIVLGLAMTGLAARVYGPSSFGLLAVAIAISVMASPLATLGMDSVVVHTLVKGDEDDADVLRTSVTLRFLAGASLLGLMALGVSNVEDASYDSAVILSLGLALVLKTGEAYLPWFQARSEIPRSTAARMIAYTGTVCIRIVVLSAGWPIAVYALTYAVDAALVWLMLYLAKRRLHAGREGKPRFSPRLGKALVARSWPLIVSGLAVSLYNRVDQLMLGVMLPDKADVGRYAASVTLAESWYFVPLAVVVARQAGVMRAHKSSESKFNQESQRLFDHAIRLSLLCALLVAVGSPVLMRLIFGAEFVTMDSIVSAIVLVAAGVLAVTGSARGPWLIARRLERYTLLYLCTGAALNVALNLVLIPSFGIVGAAFATLAAQCVSVVFLPAIIAPTRPSVVQIVRALNVRRLRRSFEFFNNGV